MDRRVIAIDGPSGAGKSSMAKRLGREFGFLHVDTGALYRAVGLAALRQGLAIDDREGVEALCGTLDVRAELSESGQRTVLNGEDVSSAIRVNEVSRWASAVSAFPGVRRFLLDTQRRTAETQNVIMDGRDIATVVLPDADLKIYLTASEESRAQRRWEELCGRGENVPLDQIRREIRARDEADMNRAVAPLRRHPDAVLVDTSWLTFDEGYALLKKTVSEGLDRVR
jgi:cytidylate kinase